MPPFWPRRAHAVEIEYWQYFFDARVTAMEQLIENFEAANPDITVKMTHFPYADYRTKVAAAIPAGEGPDVVQLFYGWLNDYVAAELIQPLPADVFPAETIDAEFFPMVQAMKRRRPVLGAADRRALAGAVLQRAPDGGGRHRSAARHAGRAGRRGRRR